MKEELQMDEDKNEKNNFPFGLSKDSIDGNKFSITILTSIRLWMREEKFCSNSKLVLES